MTDAESVKVFGWTRIAFGVACLIAPRTAARLWTGQRQDAAITPVAMRGLGARDAGLGVGILLAVERGAPVRGWLEASALADATDVVSSLTAPGASWPRRLLWAAVAGSGVYMATKLAPVVDAD